MPDGLRIGAQSIGEGAAGFDFYQAWTTVEGERTYTLSRPDISVDPRRHLVTLNGLALTIGADNDFVIDGDELTLAGDPPVGRLLTLRAALA